MITDTLAAAPEAEAAEPTTREVERPPAPEPYRARRERLLAEMDEGVAVFCSAPELVKSRDTEIHYRQNSELDYLTGFPEPAVAVLTPHDPEHRFTLFVRPRDPEKEAWNGVRAGVDGAREQYGADAAYPLDELDERLKELLEPATHIWYSLGSDEAMDARLIGWMREWRQRHARSGKGTTHVLDPCAVLDGMRQVKEPGEMELIRQACRLSAEGHLRAMAAARPGVGEWELEALIDGTFRAAGPHCGTAFPTIVGSGPNACILHYVTNDRRAQDGDLVLVDAGGTVGLYCGDITRTFPVNGRFTPAQRRVYEIVLRAEEAAIAAVRPGATIQAVHEAARDVVVRGVVELGLLSGDPAELAEGDEIKRFFMHQTSHWLGLDVHDAGSYRQHRAGDWVPLAPGMVLTIEPGLYIPADLPDVPDELRGIGVRIEDDVLVTGDGCEILTRHVPVDPDEIERLVGTDAKTADR
ncbi:MAG TPA: aminopeptidase P N-terminal domain-containing protein [Longimicrobium sp.]|nr:aminopeptidase P N-terminal domain-containing protein [Longimicrobium sp.]